VLSVRPKALDLFCGAGGAAMGLHQAGFDVVGVDIKPQPRYPFEFVQADAMTFPLDGFEFIWASPPCQKYCALSHLHPEREYPDLVAPVRRRLIDAGGLYVIENVPGAPLIRSVTYCGSMFGLRVRRHRLFESNFPLRRRLCQHRFQGRPITVSGTGGRRVRRRADDKGGNTHAPRNLAEARSAIGINWMTRYEISQAVPPAYSRYIGEQMLPHVLARMNAAPAESEVRA
jgi:DNA (cytosine-5)-methyltransferase 1